MKGTALRRKANARAAWPNICPQCNTGTRSACDCVFLLPAEACTELGAEQAAPLHQTAAAYILAPLFERWPRFAGLLLAALIVALFGLAGEPPAELLAGDYLTGDGFPAELLAITTDAAPAASEAQR
jgi:hypothetical protein